MKFQVNALPQAKQTAVGKVNTRFAWLVDPHRDEVHRRKREVATSILSGAGEIPEFFSAEAELRGLTPNTFATVIMSKPNTTDVRELMRQKALFNIDGAKTLEDVEQVLAQLDKDLSND